MNKRILNYIPGTLLLGSLLAALVLQHVAGWLPCPLCILQRLSTIALMASLFVWAYARSKKVQKYALISGGIFCILGLIEGSSHLWVLAHPSGGACAPGLGRFFGQLMDYIPGSAWLLEGGGSCETADYAIFGIPLPAMSMLTHVTGLLSAVYLAKRRS